MTQKLKHTYATRVNPDGTITLTLPMSCENYPRLSLIIKRAKSQPENGTYYARLIHKHDGWETPLWHKDSYTATDDAAAVRQALDEARKHYQDIAVDQGQVHTALTDAWQKEQRLYNMNHASSFQNIKFNDIVCNAPVHCLIEDANMLQAIVRQLNELNGGSDTERTALTDIRDQIITVITCLDTVINNHTPDTLGFNVSISTPVDLSVDNGIITDELCQDIKCGAGKPLSSIMWHGVCQCDEACRNCHKCDPENGIIFMTMSEDSGPVYTGEQNNAVLLDTLLAGIKKTN